MKKNLFGRRAFSEHPSSRLMLHVMRNITFLMLVCIMQVSATSYSQDVRLTLNLKDASLTRLFGIIQQQSDYKFLYNLEDVNNSPRLNIRVKDATIPEILAICFKDYPLGYRISNKTVVVVPRTELPVPVAEKKEVTALVVKGMVTDDKGQALPGVSVALKQSSLGTATDTEGNYSITLPDGDGTLIFSYIGFVKQEVPVNKRSSILVRLVRDVTGLQETVVVGYGTARRGDLTGAINTVSAASFEKQPVIRVEDALKGRAPGVQVQKPNGTPGAGMKIRIRGGNSITGNSDPLYVIDGIIGGDIRTLNPNDIASMDILKDASSTAIYGSRGANGVVIITTKSGRPGRPNVTFDAFYSMDKVSKKYDLLNAVEYMQVANEKQSVDGLNPLFTAAQIDEARRTGGTDWQDEILRTGSTQNYQLSFSGGTENTRYYVSGSLADQKGIIENSAYKRYGLRANVKSKMSKRLDFSLNLYGTFEKSRNIYGYDGRNTALGSALIFSPNVSVWDTATKDYRRSPSYGPITSNPVFTTNEQIFDGNILNVLASSQLHYMITDELSATISGGVNGNNYNNPYLKRYQPGNNLSSTEAGYDNGFTWTLQNTNMLNYAKMFNSIHSLKITAGYEQQLSTTKFSTAWATGFPTIALGYNDISLGATRRVGSGFSQWSLQSYLGRVNYTLKDRYLFTVTFRADGSSKFKGNNKYGYFPSGAFAWRISEEPFIHNLNVFSDLKLRTSYGLTGNQAIGPYKTLNLLQTFERGYPFNGSSLGVGIGPGTPANPDLKWETTAQLDIGLDFGFFGGRLNGALDYYHKKTTDLLLDVNIPDYNGGGTRTSNVGSLQNRGVELLLNGVVIDKPALRLETGFNISANRSKVLDLGGATEIYTNGGYNVGLNPFIVKVGEPLGQFRGYVYQGVWKTAEAAEAAKVQRQPGDAHYLNVNGDGEISGPDMMRIGKAAPDFTWGWNTTLEWRNFDLNLLFSGMQGNDVWNYTRWLPMSFSTDARYATAREVLNRWTPKNENSDIPGITTSTNTLQQSSQFVEDGSFIRLSNLSLGYNLPLSVMKSMKISQARFYVSGQNLFVITKYKGFDPELSTTPTTSDVAMGIDNSTYPAFRTITVGIRLVL